MEWYRNTLLARRHQWSMRGCRPKIVPLYCHPFRTIVVLVYWVSIFVWSRIHQGGQFDSETETQEVKSRGELAKLCRLKQQQDVLLPDTFSPSHPSSHLVTLPGACPLCPAPAQPCLAPAQLAQPCPATSLACRSRAGPTG